MTDVQLNAQLQSPLVRALSLIKSKNSSFTHGIDDNVPPLSLNKILVQNDEAGDNPQFGNKYKLSIPRYGYLRDVVLRYTLQDNPVNASIVNSLTNELYAVSAREIWKMGVFTFDTSSKTFNWNDTTDVKTPSMAGNISWALARQVVPLLHSTYRDTAAYVNDIPGTTVVMGSEDTINYFATTIYINGDIEMWKALVTFYYTLLINFYPTADGAAYNPASVNTTKWDNNRHRPIAHLILEAVFREPVRNATVRLGWGGSHRASVQLPGWIEPVASKVDGELLWIPKLPVMKYDSNGNVTGCELVRLDTLLYGEYRNSFSTSDSTLNQRVNKLNKGTPLWSPSDLVSGIYCYEDMATRIASHVELTTMNRPIQTVYSRENLMRIQRMEDSERVRLDEMMKPIIRKAKGANYNEYIFHQPLLLHSTEALNYNFDTRFVEDLELQIQTLAYNRVFHAADRGGLTGYSSLKSTFITPYIDFVLNTGLFNRDFRNTFADGTFKTDYLKVSPELWGTRLRQYNTVAKDYVKIEAILYYHNFHDSLSQTIRESNFKPNQTANLLAYNTYAEPVRPLTAYEVTKGEPININLTTNNLVNGLTFCIARDADRSSVFGGYKWDDWRQTIPIRRVELELTGQLVYFSDYNENQLCDQLDFDLGTGKKGRKYNNKKLTVVKKGGREFFYYHIGFSLNSDLTYNSGSLSFQSIQNPILRLWIDASIETPYKDDVRGQAYGVMPDVADGEFAVHIYENYWNILRIDSNTGAISRSLDV